MAASGAIPPPTGEGDQRSWWRGTHRWTRRSMSSAARLCPSTMLRMVPLPVPGRNG